MNVVDALFYFAAATALVALPFSIVNWFRYMKRRAANKFDKSFFAAGFPVKSVMFFAVPVLSAIVIAQGVASSSRDEASNFLRGLSGNYRVYVNHEPVPDADKIVSALKQMSSEWGHHSHPTKRILVEISSENGSMTFELARDSALPQEYWVFYPKYRITSNYDIGTITTPVFDQY